MGLTDTSEVLFEGMRSALETWESKQGGAGHALYWTLTAKIAEIEGADIRAALAGIDDESLRREVAERRRAADGYWDDVRYSALEPVTQLWGTIVNAVRVSADSDRVTDVQRGIFDYPADSLVAFFRAARDKMEVADGLYHCFKAMPAPECQALAALLNVHVDAPLEAAVMRRLVRLLDHEGPMSREEATDLEALTNTSLVGAAFAGSRRSA